MRISDWSSDVCSSDLPTCPANDSRKASGQQQGFFDVDLARPRIVAQQAAERGRQVGPVQRVDVKLLDAAAHEVAAELNGDGDRHGEAHLAVLLRSEAHTSELQSLMRIWYAVFGLKKKNKLCIYTE